jgi:hypothetical protein
MSPEDMRPLLDVPSAAVLAVYRADGSAYISPVWFRVADESVEIVVADGDPKIERLRIDPRCIFMAFETTPPFRGLRIESEAQLSSADVHEARLAIASRYLGDTDGRRYVEQRTKPGTVVRVALASARTWDLGSILPS